MLIVRRRAGESVLIGDDVRIEVLEITPGRVKLGVTAPKDVSVQRSEVRLTREENLAAARQMSPDRLASLASRFRKESRAGKEPAGDGKACQVEEALSHDSDV